MKTHMLLTMRWWVSTFVAALALFAFATTASAYTGGVDDPSISDFTVTAVSSTDKNANDVTISASFTTTAIIPADEGFIINSHALDCFDASDSNCTTEFDDADLTGIAGEAAETSDNQLHWVNSSDLAVGTHNITVTDVDLMNLDGGVRLFMTTPVSDTSAIDEDLLVGTPADPILVGTVLATGTVTSPGGDAVSTYGNVYNEDWSVNEPFHSDAWGSYAVGNPGFSSGDTVGMSFYPDPALGLFNTSDEFTYSGSTVTNNVELNVPAKTISGTVTYANNSAAVTTARVNFNGDGVWASADVQSDGTYSGSVPGGTYDVCLDTQWDDENNKPKEIDWYVDGESCETVTFEDNTTAETETVNYAVARTDARITGVFQNPDGSFPDDGGWVSFWNEDHWFGGQVSDDDGSFSVAVVGGNASDIQISSLNTVAVGSTTYQAQFDPWDDDESTYWDSDAVTVLEDQTKDLGTITLGARDVTVNVTVVDSNGDPVEDVYVDAWLTSGGGGWTNAQTNSSGAASVALYEGEWEMRPSTWNLSGYLYSGEPIRVDVDSGDTVEQSFELTATTVNVSVTALDPDGLVAEEVNGWVNCWSPTSFGGFGGQLDNGIGSFGAVGGSYNCNLWVDNDDYQASGDQVTTFVDGEDATLAFNLKARTATIRVNVKTQDNELIEAAGVRGWVNAHSPDSGWTDEPVGGTVDLRVAAGTYHVNVWFENGPYVSTFGPQNGITVADGETAVTTLTVFETDGTLTATVENSSGEKQSGVWVHCGNWHSVEIQGDFEGGRIIESGQATGVDGVAEIGLVTGEEYECFAHPRPDSDLIGAEAVEVEFGKKKKTAEAEFTLKEATSTISIGASLTSAASIQAAGDITQMWCGAWSENGSHSWKHSFSSTVDLPVIPDEWHVWCGTELPNGDGGFDFYEMRNDKDVNVKKDGVTKNVTVKLRKSFFSVPESVSVTFDATEAQSIVMEDGTTVEIPARAIATEGNITLTADPDLDAIRTDDIPYGFPWNFEVYDSEGSLISGDFNDEVLIHIPFDKDLLEDEFDVDPGDLQGSTYDEDNGIWDEYENGTLNEDDGMFTVSVPHFSSVGLVYNSRSITEKPNKPKKLKAKKIKRKKVRLTWKAPANATVNKYRVQVRKHKVKKKKQWRKFTKVKKQKNRTVKRKVVKKLTPDTKYQFRVKAQNSAGKSAWTKWKSFTTKE